MVIVCSALFASVKVAGETVTVMPLVVEPTLFQVVAPPERFLTVRVQVHTCTQALLTAFAKLRVRGSPFAAGLAAIKSAMLSSSVKPALTTRVGSTRPLPMLNGSAGVTPSGLTIEVLAADIIADLISIGVQVGLSWRIKALTPAECGLDMDVPSIIRNN